MFDIMLQARGGKARSAGPVSRFGMLALLVTLMLGGCSDAEPPAEAAAPPGNADGGADLIITGARVYTMTWPDPAPDGTLAAAAPFADGRWSPDAEAVVVAAGEIIYVGSAVEALAMAGADTQVVDVEGATVLPGLIDSHTHVVNLGGALSRVPLFGVETEEEAVARVAERARSVPKGEWIVGHGWDEGAWADRYPTMALLTEAVPDHPVYMRSLHSFAGWGNRMAFEKAGITTATEAPSGGEILKDADGELTGILLNRAVPLLEDAVPPPTLEQLKERIVLGLNDMAADGYTAVQDAGNDTQMMAAYEALEAEGRLPLRVYAMLSLRDAPLMRRWIARGPDTDQDSMLVTRAVKGYYDGALGSRGARLLEDYSDMPGHRGVSGDEYGYDEALAEQAMGVGFQLAIHAIGDAGNRETLDFYERVFEAAPELRNGRHRIEHAQVVHPWDIPRFGAMNVIASMEPPHAVEDKTWAEERLGPDRINGAYAWRSLREAGARLTFNADNPGSDDNIFYGMHAALTRRDKQLEPAEGWYAQQALNIDETVRAYTRWSAYAGFMEDRSGTLAPGHWADITVMDIDPFALATSEPGAILEGRILMTVVGGKVVFAADQTPATVAEAQP